MGHTEVIIYTVQLSKGIEGGLKWHGHQVPHSHKTGPVQQHAYTPSMQEGLCCTKNPPTMWKGTQGCKFLLLLIEMR